jgi:hypothetical protein
MVVGTLNLTTLDVHNSLMTMQDLSDRLHPPSSESSGVGGEARPWHRCAYQLDMHRIPIHIAVNGNCFDSQAFRSSDNSTSNFSSASDIQVRWAAISRCNNSPVSNENLVE